MQDLDTWGGAFFQALQSGDLDQIQRFVLDEADCVTLLGNAGGRRMAADTSK